jgi:hypothetical protein
LNKTLQEEGIYVWYIFCIKQSQWVCFSNDFVNIYIAILINLK